MRYRVGGARYGAIARVPIIEGRGPSEIMSTAKCNICRLKWQINREHGRKWRPVRRRTWISASSDAGAQVELVTNPLVVVWRGPRAIGDGAENAGANLRARGKKGTLDEDVRREDVRT